MEQVMLREKKVEYIYNVQHPSTEEIRYIELNEFLNPVQIKALGSNPNLILELIIKILNLTLSIQFMEEMMMMIHTIFLEYMLKVNQNYLII